MSVTKSRKLKKKQLYVIFVYLKTVLILYSIQLFV